MADCHLCADANNIRPPLGRAVRPNRKKADSQHWYDRLCHELVPVWLGILLLDVVYRPRFIWYFVIRYIRRVLGVCGRFQYGGGKKQKHEPAGSHNECWHHDRIFIGRRSSRIFPCTPFLYMRRYFAYRLYINCNAFAGINSAVSPVTQKSFL